MQVARGQSLARHAAGAASSNASRKVLIVLKVILEQMKLAGWTQTSLMEGTIERRRFLAAGDQYDCNGPETPAELQQLQR